MDKLNKREFAQVVAALVEGNGIRATVRITGVTKNTVTNTWLTLVRLAPSSRMRHSEL